MNSLFPPSQLKVEFPFLSLEFAMSKNDNGTQNSSPELEWASADDPFVNENFTLCSFLRLYMFDM